MYTDRGKLRTNFSVLENNNEEDFSQKIFARFCKGEYERSRGLFCQKSSVITDLQPIDGLNWLENITVTKRDFYISNPRTGKRMCTAPLNNGRIVTTGSESVRVMLHDIFLSTFMIIDQRYRQRIAEYDSDPNEATKPVNNDGKVGKRIIEFKTSINKMNNKSYDGESVREGKVDFFLHQYKRFTDTFKDEKGIKKHWKTHNIDGITLILQDISSEGPMLRYLNDVVKTNNDPKLKKLMDILLYIPSMFAKTNLDELISDNKEFEKLSNEEMIKPFMENLDLYMEDHKFMDNCFVEFDKFKDRWADKSSEWLRKNLIKEMRECNERAVEVFLTNKFLNTEDMCDMIPDFNTGMRPTEEMTKDFTESKVSPIISMGGRNGFSKFTEHELRVRFRSGEKFISHPLECGKNKDQIMGNLNLLEGVKTYYSTKALLKEEDYDKLKDLNKKIMLYKHHYYHTQKKEQRENEASVSEMIDKVKEIFDKAPKPERKAKFTYGGLVSLKDRNETKHMGITQKDVRKGDFIRDVVCIDDELEAAAADEMINDMYKTLKEPTDEELDNVLGHEGNLNLETLLTTDGIAELHRLGLTTSYHTVRKIIKEKTFWYQFKCVKDVEQILANVERESVKSAKVTSFYDWETKDGDCCYLSSVGKSKTQTGSIIRILKLSKEDLKGEDILTYLKKHIHILDTKPRGWLEGNDAFYIVFQSIRKTCVTFYNTHEYMFTYFAYRLSQEIFGMNKPNLLSLSTFLDYKREIARILDVQYLMTKQVGSAGGGGRFDMAEKFEGFVGHDIRVNVMLYRLKKGFVDFSKKIRREVVNNRGWDFSKKIREPITGCLCSDLAEVGIFIYWKQSGFKDDGQDNVQYKFKFLKKEMAFEKEYHKLDLNNMEKVFKVDTMLEFLNRTSKLNEETGEIMGEKQAQHMPTVYKAMLLMFRDIKEKSQTDGMFNLEGKTDEGTPSIIYVPVPITIMATTGLEMMNKAAMPNKQWVPVNKINNQKILENEMNKREKRKYKADLKSDNLRDALENRFRIMSSILTVADDQVEKSEISMLTLENCFRIVNEFWEKSKNIINKNNTVSEKNIGEYNLYNVITEPNNNDGDSDVSSETSEDIEDSEENLNSEIDRMKVYANLLNDDKDHKLNFEDTINNLYSEMDKLMGKDKAQSENIQILQFLNYFWALMPTPLGRSFTTVPVVQQHALLAATDAYTRVFNLKRKVTLLELSLFINKIERCQASVRSCIKDQIGSDKRAFYIQSFNLWLVNKTTENLVKKFLGKVKQDVIHLAGNEKLMAIEEVKKKFFGMKRHFHMTSDKTRYGDLYSLYVLACIWMAAWHTGLITKEQCQYCLMGLNMISNRTVEITNEYVEYLMKYTPHLLNDLVGKGDNGKIYRDNNGISLAVKQDPKDARKKHERYQMNIEINSASVMGRAYEILTFLQDCRKGYRNEFYKYSQHTLGHFYIPRTPGFILGVQNFAGSAGSANAYFIMEEFLNYIFEGLKLTTMSHSDDSTAFASSKPVTREYIENLDPYNNKILKLIKKGYKGRFVFDKLGEFKELVMFDEDEEDERKFNFDETSIISALIISFDCLLSRCFGQRTSSTKCVYGDNIAEFLQVLVHKQSCIQPIFSSIAPILKQTAGRSPSLDLMDYISRLYACVATHLPTELINGILMFVNWWVKEKFRLPKKYYWDRFPQLLGSYYASPGQILMCRFEANTVRLLSYVENGESREKANFILNQFIYLQNNNNYWQKFGGDTAEDENFSINMDSEFRASSLNQLGLVFKKNIYTLKVNGGAILGASEIEPKISAQDGESIIEKVSNYIVMEHFKTIINFGGALPKLLKNILQTMKNNDLASMKIHKGYVIIGEIGYLNRSMISKDKKESKQLREILDDITELCKRKTVKEVSDESPESARIVRYTMKLYANAIEAMSIKLKVKDVTDESIRIGKMIGEMLFYKKRIVVRTGLTETQCNLLISILLEQCIEFNQRKKELKDDDITNLQPMNIIETLAYNLYPTQCTEENFILFYNETVLAMDVTKTTPNKLMSQLDNWKQGLLADTFDMIAKMYSSDYASNLIKYNGPSNYVIETDNMGKGRLNDLSNSQRFIIDTNIEKETGLLMTALYSGFYFKKIKNELVNLVEEVSLNLRFIGTLMGKDYLVNSIVRMIYFDTIDEDIPYNFRVGCNSNCCYMSWSGRYLIIVSVEADDDVNYHFLGVTNDATFFGVENMKNILVLLFRGHLNGLDTSVLSRIKNDDIGRVHGNVTKIEGNTLVTTLKTRSVRYPIFLVNTSLSEALEFLEVEKELIDPVSDWVFDDNRLLWESDDKKLTTTVYNYTINTKEYELYNSRGETNHIFREDTVDYKSRFISILLNIRHEAVLLLGVYKINLAFVLLKVITNFKNLPDITRDTEDLTMDELTKMSDNVSRAIEDECSDIPALKQARLSVRDKNDISQIEVYLNNIISTINNLDSNLDIYRTSLRSMENRVDLKNIEKLTDRLASEGVAFEKGVKFLMGNRSYYKVNLCLLGLDIIDGIPDLKPVMRQLLVERLLMNENIYCNLYKRPLSSTNYLRIISGLKDEIKLYYQMFIDSLLVCREKGKLDFSKASYISLVLCSFDTNNRLTNDQDDELDEDADKLSSNGSRVEIEIIRKFPTSRVMSQISKEILEDEKMSRIVIGILKLCYEENIINDQETIRTNYIRYVVGIFSDDILNKVNVIMEEVIGDLREISEILLDFLLSCEVSGVEISSWQDVYNFFLSKSSVYFKKMIIVLLYCSLGKYKLSNDNDLKSEIRKFI
jgi:hypothetical protein